jgi:hypothetical protein
MSFDDLSLLLGVIEILVVLYILFHGLWFPVLQYDIFTYSVSILIHSSYAYLKCEIALVLTSSCSMYYNCSILYLDSYVARFVHRLWSVPIRLYLLLVRLDLFATLCHNAFCHDPCMHHHGVRLQCRCDFQLSGFYPCFEISCCGDLHFSCCGWRVGAACDCWWLFLLLWLLCLGHMCFDLLCYSSGLCLPWGLSKLSW